MDALLWLYVFGWLCAPGSGAGTRRVAVSHAPTTSQVRVGAWLDRFLLSCDSACTFSIGLFLCAAGVCLHRPCSHPECTHYGTVRPEKTAGTPLLGWYCCAALRGDWYATARTPAPVTRQVHAAPPPARWRCIVCTRRVHSLTGDEVSTTASSHRPVALPRIAAGQPWTALVAAAAAAVGPRQGGQVVAPTESWRGESWLGWQRWQLNFRRSAPGVTTLLVTRQHPTNGGGQRARPQQKRRHKAPSGTFATWTPSRFVHVKPPRALKLAAYMAESEWASAQFLLWTPITSCLSVQWFRKVSDHV